VLSAGHRIGTQPARPCNAVSECLEAVAGNNENIDVPDNNVYLNPVQSSTNNDHLVIVRP
jgi:hypothetical protein